jgi:hypothetical protein
VSSAGVTGVWTDEVAHVGANMPGELRQGQMGEVTRAR